MKTASVSEFQRPVELDELDDGDIHRTIEADAGELQALARRFDLVAIHALHASVRVRRMAGGPLVRVEGRLTADVVQRCVVTLAPLPVRIEEDVAETFAPAGYRAPGDVADRDLPEVLDEGRIDLGELAAQLLFLLLDPYPRAPQADAAQQLVMPGSAGERARPFEALGEMLAKRRK